MIEKLVTMKTFAVSSLLLGSLLVSGCSTKSTSAVEVIPQTRVAVITAPGVVDHIWEEPMVDVVDVPPGLDPEGRYYRPSHQAIVEIRQGHWRQQGQEGQK